MNSKFRLAQLATPLLIGLLVFLGTGCQSPDAGAKSEKTMKRLRERAQAGKVDAQFHLGRIYSLGDGVPRNDDEAFHWLQLAADQGHAEAQYYLGLFYKEGRGTDKNLMEAYKWFNLAAARGNANAEIRMETVSRAMSREQVTEAQRAAMNFKAGRSVPAESPLAREELELPVRQTPAANVLPPSQPESADVITRNAPPPAVKQPVVKASPPKTTQPAFGPVPPPSESKLQLPAETSSTNEVTSEKPERPAATSGKKWWPFKSKPEPVFAPVPPPTGE